MYRFDYEYFIQKIRENIEKTHVATIKRKILYLHK